jgi:hypothetical protein
VVTYSRPCSSLITFDEIEQVLDRPPGLFSPDFQNQHHDQIVEWTVKVIQVEPLVDGEVDSDFLVHIVSKDSITSHRASAIFPARLREVMIHVGAGDIIRFRGILKFRDPWYVAVENCELLEHHKSKTSVTPTAVPKPSGIAVETQSTAVRCPIYLAHCR